MNEVCVEALVRRPVTMQQKVLFYVLVGVAVIAAYLAITILPLAGIAAIAAGIAAFSVKEGMDTEFEYAFFDGELSIDKVVANSRRKHLADFLMMDVQIIAPVDSAVLGELRHRRIRKKDFSAGAQTGVQYAIYLRDDLKVLFTPSVKLLTAMKKAAPQKVVVE